MSTFTNRVQFLSIVNFAIAAAAPTPESAAFGLGLGGLFLVLTAVGWFADGRED